MINTLILKEDKTLENIQTLDAEKLKLSLDNKKNIVFIDILNPEQNEIDFLLDTMQFHPISIEKVILPQQHAKIEFLEDYVFLTFHSILWDEKKNIRNSIITKELDVYIGKNYIITVHDEQMDCIKNIVDRIRTNLSDFGKGIDFILYIILDKIVDNYFPILDKLNSLLETLDNEIVNNINGHTMQKILAFKREILFFRKMLVPQRNCLSQLVVANSVFIRTKSLVYFRDIYQHILIVSDMIESFRELINTSIEVHVSMISNRLNEIMKTLTVVATFAMPLTLIASFYGMNIKAPEFEWGRQGYYFVILLMALVVVLMYMFFKKRKYF